MPTLPITLSVDRKPAETAKKRPQTEDILARDNFTCRCCGFKSKRYQRVIPWISAKGTDSKATTSDAFITVCSFCELCFTLDRTGMTAAGTLIWLPELSQAELNHLVRAIYLARETEGALGIAAKRAQDVLLSRRTEAKKRLGSDDPLLLATALQENLTDAEYAVRAAKLDGIRLFPMDRWLVRGREGDIDCFPQMLNYWRSPEGPFGQMPLESWEKRFAETENLAL